MRGTGMRLVVGCGAALMASPVWGAETATSSLGESRGVGLLVVYCLLVAASSWLGGVLPSLVNLTHTRLQLLISLIGGLMLGVGLLHQLPHAVAVLSEAGVPHALDHSCRWMLIGLAAMFFIQRMFHFHQHDNFHERAHAAEQAPSIAVVHHHDHDHDHAHDHDHSHDHDCQGDHHPGQPHAGHSHAGHSHAGHVHGTSWMGIALGLSLHTLTDGLALAAHVQADVLHHATIGLAGLGTFLGIVLHKPLDSLSITSLMSAGGSSMAARRWVNFGYALLCPLGAMLCYFGLGALSTGQAYIVGTTLAFSAGVFVCIALSDLLPEVEFHSHDRVPLSAALITGLVVSWLIGFLEPEHSHGGAAPSSAHQGTHQHDHDH